MTGVQTCALPIFITSVVYDAKEAGSNLSNVASIVTLKPVVANPVVLTAADFNSRIDADGTNGFKFKLSPDGLIGSEPFAEVFTAENDGLGLGSTVEPTPTSDLASSKVTNLLFGHNGGGHGGYDRPGHGGGHGGYGPAPRYFYQWFGGYYWRTDGTNWWWWCWYRYYQYWWSRY